jgi:hypothetical protein
VAEEIEAVDDFHGLQPCPSVRHSQGGPIYRPKNVAPQEAVPMLMGAMGQWVEKYGKRFSTLEFFVGGGGLGVIDVDGSAELQRTTAENPFTPYSEVEFLPVVEPSAAIAICSEAIAALHP